MAYSWKDFDWRHPHDSLAFDLLRAFLGVALFVRGWVFIADQQALMDLVLASRLDWFMPIVLVHYITLAHLVGGLMLAAGLFTRLAALVQIPILVGAVFFVHIEEGLFAPGQSLELAALVLFLLLLVAVFGPGHFSLDYALFGKKKEQAAHPQPSALDLGGGPISHPEPTHHERRTVAS